jgi:hypothetical protein
MLVPAWIFACAFVLCGRELALRQMRSNLMMTADMVRQNQVELSDNARALLMSLAGERLTKTPSSAAFAEKLGWSLASNPFLCNIGFINPQGAVVSSAVPLHGKMYLGDRSYFQRTLKERVFSVGLFQIGRITGQPSINFGYPVFDEHKRVQGVLFAAIDLSWIQKIAMSMPLPRGWVISLMDSEGTVVMRYPEPDKWTGRKYPRALVERVKAEHGGIIETVGIDGNFRSYAYLPVKDLEPNPLYIGVGFSMSSLLMPYNKLLALALIGFMASVFISFFLAHYLGAKWMAAPTFNTVGMTRLDPPLLSPSASTIETRPS